MKEGVVDVSQLGAASPKVASADQCQTPVCATCELEVPWTPVRRVDKAFCCTGCAVGGPCTCSYDDFNTEDTSMSTTNTIVDTRASPRAMPMTRDVLRRLESDVERLVDELPALQMQAREHGVSGDAKSPTVLAAGDLHLASRRLETLRRVIAEAHVVEPDGRIVIGSRV